MDERLRESISALMDDESNELELQRVLSHSDTEDVQELWRYYHQIRHTVQQDSQGSFNVDISAGVAAAIRDESEGENDRFAVESSGLEPRGASDKESSLDNVSVIKPQRELASSDKRLGGRAWLALAASVAFAFIFAFHGGPGASKNDIPSVASNLERDASLLKVSSAAEPKIIVEMTEEQAHHFSQYLLRHAEHSVRGTQSGFMPLARVASVNSVGI